MSKYDELDASIDYLSEYIQQYGPFDGIIGFSQGAVMTMVLTALCEAGTLPGRAEALLQQPVPIRQAAPQAPFKFTISISGYKASERLYSGCFEPRINTPSLHILAELDTMVENSDSIDLVNVCVDAKVITHVAGHVVPTSSTVLRQMADFVQDCSSSSINISGNGTQEPPSPITQMYRMWQHGRAKQQRPCLNRVQSEADTKWAARPAMSVRSLSSRSLSSDTTSLSSSSSSSSEGQKCVPVIRQHSRRRVVRIYREAA